MKTGLVLEGGGLRGIFSAGVLDVLMEEGVKFDGAVGVSAGAAFGSNYKSGQNRRAIRYNLRFAKDPRYSSVMSLIATGNLFNAQFCYHDIPEKLDPFDWEAFRKNPMEFYLVCTDVETGKPVYHMCDNDSEHEMLEWFRASGSMPLVSKVVEIEGKKLLDGGISDSIPLRFMEEQGYQRNIVVLTQPANYVKSLNPLMGMVERGLRSYPNAVEAIRNRHIVYNEELAYVRQRESGKQAFVIRPDHALDIGRIEHDRMKIRAAYKAGRRKARKLLPEILRFLEGAKAEDTGINASLVEEDVKVTDVVRPSLVEDPAMVSGAVDEEGFGKTYEESPEEISGRENKDVPEELHGIINKDTSETIIENKEVDVPDAGTSTEEAEPAGTKASGVTSASLVNSIDPYLEEDDSSKDRVQEVRAVILPEEEEELSAFQRPFPMGRAMDEPVNAEEEPAETAEPAAPGEEAEAEVTETAEAETAETESIEEEAEAETVAEAEEAETAEAEETEAEPAEEEAAEAEAAEEEAAETEEAEAEIEESAAEEPAAEESVEEEPAPEESASEEPAVEVQESEEPAAEEAAEEAKEAESEEPAAEAAEEAGAETEEPAAEEAAEEAKETEPEEPAAEEAAEEVEEAGAETEELAAEEAAEEAKEAESEEPAAETSETDIEETAESSDDSETPAESAAGEEASGSSPVSYRKKTRKQKKVWKPGNMTALKEKAKAEDQK